jgi:peptide/nickel transport system substrate-binding protein
MEDIRFTVEDVLFNKELTPAFPVWLKSGGKVEGNPFSFQVVDDLAFKIKFDQPYGGFLIRTAIQGWRGYTDLLKPAHYLKAFHNKYADAGELEAEIKEAGFQPGEWWNLFNDKDITNWELTNSKAIGFPVLYPWIYVKKTTTTAMFERNPYYFKIDADGNQLPYIDRIESTLVEDIEMVTLKIIGGEVDFAYGLFTSMPKIPLYKENEDRAGYKVYMTKYHTTPTDIHLNLTHSDPVWRSVVQDVRFRKALNMAINREEIIDSV